ncbi:MAG: hypothetical protein ACLS4Z_03495 [Christensenellaceae bacterium]
MKTAPQITLEQADRLAEIVLVEAKNPKTGIVKRWSTASASAATPPYC